MGWDYAFSALGKRVLGSAELLALGASERSLTAAVRGGFLIRARRDHYLLPDTDPDIVRAIRVGGRLACVSALRESGIFAVAPLGPHVHIDTVMSHLRSPAMRAVPLSRENRDGAELHWGTLMDSAAGSDFSVSTVDALAQVVRCQPPRLAVASIDNALHLRRVSASDIDSVFHGLPSRFQELRSQVDGRAEAGQETILRLIIRDAGLSCVPQVTIPGVGRVDLLVEKRLVVEADSRLAHDGWDKHVEDRRRDLALAARGLMSLRPTYEHTLSSPDLVRRAILGLLSTDANAARR